MFLVIGSSLLVRFSVRVSSVIKANAPNSQPTRDVGHCGSMDAPKAPDPDANPRRNEGKA